MFLRDGLSAFLLHGDGAFHSPGVFALGVCGRGRQAQEGAGAGADECAASATSYAADSESEHGADGRGAQGLAAADSPAAAGGKVDVIHRDVDCNVGLFAAVCGIYAVVALERGGDEGGEIAVETATTA